MRLPGGHVASAAATRAELSVAQSLAAEPMPPIRARRRRPGEGLHIVYLLRRTGIGGGVQILLEHANHLEALGAVVTVMSHHSRPDWFELRSAFVRVPFGQRLDRSIPACDLIVAGYWSHVLPARYLGIAPVVHFEQGDFHLYDELGTGMHALVAASVRAADWTITVDEAPLRALAERYGVHAECVPVAVEPAVLLAAPTPIGRTGLRCAQATSGSQVAAGLLERYGELVASAPLVNQVPVAPLARGAVDLDGVTFRRDGDRDMFFELLGRCRYQEVAIPVSRPLLGRYRLVRWTVVARRPDGEPGKVCLHLPAHSDAPVDDARYQFGIDLLREGLAEEAFTWFACQSRQAPDDEQVLLGRWIVLSLLVGGRTADARSMAETLAAAHPAHADYYLLALHAAEGPVGGDSTVTGDELVQIRDTLDILGPGALFDEWLDTSPEQPFAEQPFAEQLFAGSAPAGTLLTGHGLA